MPTAVFDFDETLIYLPSALIWSRKIGLIKKLQIPLLYLLGKLDGVPSCHEKAFEWLVGKDISETIDQIKDLPPVPGGVTYFQQLAAQGYKMIVMSYSPGVFVAPWLSANGLKAQLLCPNLIVSNSMLRRVSQDPVTQIYLKEPNNAKAKVLAKLHITPDICVGDNERRDGLCDQYVDIRSLEPNYKNRIQRHYKIWDFFFE
jgi:phosphoserine phosphatase